SAFSESLECQGCGRVGQPEKGRKKKVLGLRPYLDLVPILGSSATKDLMKRLQDLDGNPADAG
ncbi:MAG: hypothetical protein AAF623_09690, partial [Planctomycetota bacterium]